MAASVGSGALKPSILVTEELGAAGIAMLKEFAEVDASYTLTPDQLLAKISLVDGLIIRSATKVTRAVFEAAKGRLKVVGRAGVGVDNVDLTAATEHGCLVVNAPTANTVAAAEHGIALMCALARNVAQADASMKKGEWKRNKYVGTSLVGKTIAVVGFGKVGSEVGRRAKGLGMTVLAYDPYASAEKVASLGATLVNWDTALAEADFISLHMPLLPSTKNMLNEEAFAKCKKGVRVINVARGGVIDEAALARALDAGIVAGAALDVFAEEPPKHEGHPLIGRPDVIVTPHLGASTTEAQEGVSIEIVEAIRDALAGKLSANVVNAPLVPSEVLKELEPYVFLAEGLGEIAMGLVADSGVSAITITYTSSRGNELDSRLLRASVIKGMLEQTTTSRVNLVNADLLAKKRGIRVTEITHLGEGTEILSSLSITLETASTKFSGALDKNGHIHVQGAVRNGQPFVTMIGQVDVELATNGCVILIRQRDVPGVVGAVGTLLGVEKVNISFMTVARQPRTKEAVMAIGVDSPPSVDTLTNLKSCYGVLECCLFSKN